jgi:hypothetical protein
VLSDGIKYSTTCANYFITQASILVFELPALESWVTKRRQNLIYES